METGDMMGTGTISGKVSIEAFGNLPFFRSDKERFNRTKANWDAFWKQLGTVVVHLNTPMALKSSIWMMEMRSFWKPGVTMVHGVSALVNVEEA